jgi:hypothetical protein
VHVISGLVAERSSLGELGKELGIKELPTPLKHGLAFLPIDDMSAGSLMRSGDCPIEAFQHLTPALLKTLEERSGYRTLAYIETEYFGGTGVQGAVVCAEGRTIMGPEQGDGVNGPISRAMRCLGVQASSDSIDEFAETGLSEFRSNDDWRRAAPSR